jgi:hypothetical protein
MADTKIILDPSRPMRTERVKETTKLGQEEMNQFLNAVDRAYAAKKPAAEDMSIIRQFLKDYPVLAKAVFPIVESTQDLIIKNLMGDYVVAETAIREQLLYIRDEMGYHDAPIMEKLLIEQIVTCWLRVQHCESIIAFMMGKDKSATVLNFWENRLSMCQRRYLAACETLAKIRKLKIPAMQVNIGDKQVNVSGDLKPGTTEIINV